MLAGLMKVQIVVVVELDHGMKRKHEGEGCCWLCIHERPFGCRSLAIVFAVGSCRGMVIGWPRESGVVSIDFVYVLTTTATSNHITATRGLPMQRSYQ